MMYRKTRMLIRQLIVNLCFLIFFPLLTQAQDVTITIGEGAGLPGSLENPVAVNLDNPNDEVKGFQIDVCDVDNFLTVYNGCETTVRTTHFSCDTNELVDGCVRVILSTSELDDQGDPYLIETGTGSIFSIKYDVSGEAPAEECRDLNPRNVIVADENNHALDDVTAELGEFCFVTTTTTTVPIATTTTTVPITTTTTTKPSSCEVSISPLSVTIGSGTTLQFNVKTSCGKEEVEGTYTWQIVPESTIGSTIDQNGLFTAGDNTTDSDIEETVKVTDTAHENEFATATVTIEAEVEPLPECEVTINPSSATVYSGDALTLVASTMGIDCEPGNYEWSINSDIESMIEQDGAYTAGSNDTGSQVTDIITVVDHANSDITGSANIYVESEEADKIVLILPGELLGSRWISLSYFLLILGKDTNFNLSSTISIEPGDDIFELFHVGCGDILLAMVILRDNPQEGPVTITINTGGEVVTGEINIVLLPLLLAEDYLGITESHREISLDTLI